MFKKSTATEFRIPSLAEADPDTYGALIAKHDELHGRLSSAKTAAREAEAELKANPAPALRAGVAELLGDAAPVSSGVRQRLAEANRSASDIEAAIEIVRQRIRDARGPAARMAAATVRPEFERRVVALCGALRVADQAHAELARLIDDLEAGDIHSPLLGENALFLGNPRESDRPVERFIRMNKERGYAV